MKYALLIYEPASEFAKRTSADAPAYWAAWSAYGEAIKNAGIMAGGATAKTRCSGSCESSGRLVAAVQSEQAGEAIELSTLPMMREYVERQRDVCV